MGNHPLITGAGIGFCLGAMESHESLHIVAGSILLAAVTIASAIRDRGGPING